MNNLTTKSCLACNKLLNGRVDKKFCSDYCRNAYNYQQQSGTMNYARNIIYALRKNRRILASLLGDAAMVKTTRERLLLRGFQFKYHTHLNPTKKGGHYIFCFEMGYLALQHDWYLIVKREDDRFN